MTENKRYSFNWERGHPNFWDNYCDLADCYLTCEDVVDRLNELNDENKDLEEARSYYQENFLTMKTERNQLKEENEQLKQDIENLKITIKARETLIDVCEKKFNELGFIITVDDDGYVIE